MKRLILTHIGGDNIEVDVPDLGDLMSAVARQDPCFPLTLDDDSTLYLNTRHVVAWTALDVEGEEPDAESEAPAEDTPALSESDSAETPPEPEAEEPESDAPTEEPAPPVKMIPDPDPQADPDRTVAQLKEALDKAGVEYPSDARKADLQELARTNNV